MYFHHNFYILNQINLAELNLSFKKVYYKILSSVVVLLELTSYQCMSEVWRCKISSTALHH